MAEREVHYQLSLSKRLEFLQRCEMVDLLQPIAYPPESLPRLGKGFMEQGRKQDQKGYVLLICSIGLIFLSGCAGGFKGNPDTAEAASYQRNRPEPVGPGFPSRIEETLPSSTGTELWMEGLRDLIFQVLWPFPADRTLRIHVGDFVEAGRGTRPPLSIILESDLRSTLTDV